MLVLTYLGEATGQMALAAVIPQLWAVPFLLWLRFINTAAVSKWTTWLVMTFFLGSPYGKLPTLDYQARLFDFGENLIIAAHPIQVGWVSRNANTVRSRTVGAAMYNMCVQA